MEGEAGEGVGGNKREQESGIRETEGGTPDTCNDNNRAVAVLSQAEPQTQAKKQQRLLSTSALRTRTRDLMLPEQATTLVHNTHMPIKYNFEHVHDLDKRIQTKPNEDIPRTFSTLYLTLDPVLRKPHRLLGCEVQGLYQAGAS